LTAVSSCVHIPRSTLKRLAIQSRREVQNPSPSFRAWRGRPAMNRSLLVGHVSIQENVRRAALAYLGPALAVVMRRFPQKWVSSPADTGRRLRWRITQRVAHSVRRGRERRRQLRHPLRARGNSSGVGSAAHGLRRAGAGAEMTITAERRQDYVPGFEGVVHQVHVTLADSPTTRLVDDLLPVGTELRRGPERRATRDALRRPARPCAAGRST
jgi:hypothetical protein